MLSWAIPTSGSSPGVFLGSQAELDDPAGTGGGQHRREASDTRSSWADHNRSESGGPRENAYWKFTPSRACYKFSTPALDTVTGPMSKAPSDACNFWSLARTAAGSTRIQSNTDASSTLSTAHRLETQWIAAQLRQPGARAPAGSRSDRSVVSTRHDHRSSRRTAPRACPDVPDQLGRTASRTEPFPLTNRSTSPVWVAWT